VFEFFVMFSFPVVSTMVFPPALLNNFISVAIMVHCSAPSVHTCMW